MPGLVWFFTGSIRVWCLEKVFCTYASLRVYTYDGLL
jgi:hypothetical protein